MKFTKNLLLLITIMFVGIFYSKKRWQFVYFTFDFASCAS